MPVAPSPAIAFRPAKLRQFIADAFATVGLGAAAAQSAADVLATADEFGVSTHGVKLLHVYLTRLKGGGINKDARPRALSEGPAFALVDGEHGLGMLTGVHAIDVAIAKAKSAGIAFVGVRNSSHFGAAGYYALRAARQGLIGIAVANDTPSVAPPGATRPVVGTDPFAYAIPAGKHPPILLDVAISTVAGGKVYQSRMLGKPIPGDWIVGLDGKPTTDANLYPESAYLVPAGGHKGYGLALLIESLSGLVTGAGVTSGVLSWMFIPASAPSNHGAAFIAIDPKLFGPEDAFRERVDAMIDEIHATPAVEGKRVMVPGELEHESQRRAQQQPMTMGDDVAQMIRRAAEIAGLSLESYVEA